MFRRKLFNIWVIFLFVFWLLSISRGSAFADCCCDSGGYRVGDICVGITCGCGACGQSCCAEGSHYQCVCACPPVNTCTPDSSCAANTCIGDICTDKCGNTYSGTKVCISCNTSDITLSVRPNPAGTNSSLTFEITGDASTYIGDDYGGGVVANSCTGDWNNKTCISSSTPGTYTWTHTWKHCIGDFYHCSDLCSKSINYTLVAPTPTPVIATCSGASVSPSDTVTSGTTVTYNRGAGYFNGQPAIYYGIGYKYGSLSDPITYATSAASFSLKTDASLGSSLWFITTPQIVINGVTYSCRYNGWSPSPPNSNPQTSCTNNCSVNVCLRKPPIVSASCDPGPISSQTVSLNWTVSDWGFGCPNSPGTDLYYYFVPEGSSDYYGNPVAYSGSTRLTGVTPPYPLSSLNDGTYYWQVQAYNNLGAGNTANSGVCGIKVDYNKDPWWQTQDGDVHGQTSLISIIPNTIDASQRYLSLASLNNSPGIVSLSSLVQLHLGSGSISPNDWQAQVSLKTPKLSYDYLYNKLKIASQNLITDLSLFDTPQTGTRIFFVNGDASFSASRKIASDEKILVFVTGQALISANLTVDPGGFLAIISRGGIVFESAVTQAQGMFLTDGNLEVQFGSSQFVGEGSFLAAGDITLRRDLGGETNRNQPAELFKARPDLYLNAPKEFLITPSVFQEVAP